LTADEGRRFMAKAVDAETGNLRGELIGQPAAAIAAALGIERPYPVRLLIVRATTADLDGFCAGEELAPVLSLFTVSSDDAALVLCRRLLHRAGAGHTAIVHTASAAR